MKKILISLIALGAMAVFAAPAKAEIVTSTGSTVGVVAKASQSNGTIVEACVVSASTSAANTFKLYDGATLKFVLSVPAATSYSLNFKELLKEEWVVSGAFTIKATSDDAAALASCSVYQKRGN